MGGEKVPYPIGFRIFLLDFPYLKESGYERRADLGHNIFGYQ